MASCKPVERKSRPHALEDREWLESRDPDFILWQPGLPTQAVQEADGRLGSDVQDSSPRGGMQGKEGQKWEGMQVSRP